MVVVSRLAHKKKYTNPVVAFASGEAVTWATENGIINGKGGGILDPKGLATRAQVAQMLMNYLKK